MASQRLVIAKIGGLAANVALDRFRSWTIQRLIDNAQEWGADQWPDEIRRQADEWFESLRQNAQSPPTVFYAEYIDLWSFCPPYRFIGEAEKNLLCMCANRFEGFCIQLPLTTLIAERLQEVSRDGQFPEDRLFAWLTLHAATEWSEVFDGGVLIFLRETFRGSTEDHEILDSLRIAPDWMPISKQSS